MPLHSRLPAQGDILQAAGGGFFLIFTWALRGFLYQLSSLLLYHSVGDIFAILAYMLALALLETFAVLAILIALASLLPAHWLRQGFGGKAFLILLIGGAASTALASYLSQKMTAFLPLAGGLALALLLLGSSFLLLERLPAARRALGGFLERLSIFAWIYLPLGILSLLVVLIRNLG